MKQTNAIMKFKIFISWAAVSLTACSSAYPPRDTATLDGINQQLKQSAVSKAKAATEPPLPEAVSSFVLPPPKRAMPKASSKQLEQRFDLTVRDTPVDQVLMGIVSDTPYSIIVKPKNEIPSSPGAASATMALMDKMTVNLKDVTVFEALDSIREVYGYDYTVEGNRIYVQQPELQTRLYQVNYIIGQRRGVSDLQVVGGPSSSSGSSSGVSGQGQGQGQQSSGTGGGYSSVQASALSTLSKSDVWGEIEDTLRTTLGCEIPNIIAGAAGTARSSRADVSSAGDTQAGERKRGVNGCTDGRALSINPMSGTIMVRGMPNEHRIIGKMLRSMQLNIERQVIIEAKVIDVELNSASQQGINWAAFNNNQHRFSVGANTTGINATGGTLIGGTTLGGLLGGGSVGANAISSGLGVAVQSRNFMGMINFMETQGSVHVLSSPRISTLNNQKAVIKVGSEEPFVTNSSGGSVVTNNNGQPTITNPTITYQPFFSGISLDVTPQIDDKGNITLHVHTMVNSITVKDKLAIVGINGASDRSLPFAVNSINETDSVVKTNDGQVVVVGGLMTESSVDNRSKIPGVGDIPGLGALFSNGGQSKIKRELVILLKPTVVKDDSAWTDDIAAVQGRIENIGASTQSQTKHQ